MLKAFFKLHGVFQLTGVWVKITHSDGYAILGNGSIRRSNITVGIKGKFFTLNFHFCYRIKAINNKLTISGVRRSTYCIAILQYMVNTYCRLFIARCGVIIFRISGICWVGGVNNNSGFTCKIYGGFICASHNVAVSISYCHAQAKIWHHTFWIKLAVVVKAYHATGCINH